MIVYVLVNITDGYVYGVFSNEDDAYEWGNVQLRGIPWKVFEKVVQ